MSGAEPGIPSVVALFPNDEKYAIFKGNINDFHELDR
jgi:hypothetical protein